MTLEYLRSLQPDDFSQIQFAILFALSASSLVQFRLCSSHFLCRSLSFSTRAANESLRILRKVLQSRRRLVGACFQLGEGPSWGILRDCKSSHNHREPWFAALLSTGTQVPLRPRTCPVQSVQSGATLQSSNLLADNTWAPRLAACTALQLLAFPGVSKCSYKMQYRDEPAYV